MTDTTEPVLGNDGLTDSERAAYLVAFQAGVGRKDVDIPTAVEAIGRAVVEEAIAAERAAWTARVEEWASLLESESPVGTFIAAEARTRLLVDGTISLDTIRERAGRQALIDAADALDDHTNCDCEDGDHLTRLASSTWLRNRATRAKMTGETSDAEATPA